MPSRRHFIRNTALGLGAASLYPVISKGTAPVQSTKISQKYTVGIADYTFRDFNIRESIKMMQELDIHDLSVKDFHLPLDSSPEKISQVIQQYDAKGIKIYAVGVIYMRTKEQVDQAFRYAKQAGVPLIVGVPVYDLLDYTEQKVKEYNIKIAIHNHGPQDKLYPGPKEVYEKIQRRDKRMGLCLDIGHAIRAGEEPAAAVKKYGHRIYDMHVKDVTKAAAEGQAIQVGRGVIDFPALVSALREMNYQGHCSIEYEKNTKDKTDQFAGIAESLGYFKGVSQSIA